MVSFVAAEMLLVEFADIHQEPAVNRGAIALNRRAAEAVREIQPCAGPSPDRNGNIHCPLAGMIADTYAMVVWRPAPTVIPPEKVSPTTEAAAATGAYL